MTKLAWSYGIFENRARNFLTMVNAKHFSFLLNNRARIVDDNGGGKFSIPGDNEVIAPEGPGRRVRSLQVPMHEEPA